MKCDNCQRDVTWTRASTLIEATTEHKTYTMIAENDAGDEEVLVGFTRNKANLVDGMIHDGPMLWFKCVDCFVRNDPKQALKDAASRTRRAHAKYREAQRDEMAIMDADDRLREDA